MNPRAAAGMMEGQAPIALVGLLAVGVIVLCKVSGSEYLHLVKAIQGERFQIGNNRGHINGWVGPNAIYGRLVSVAP